MSTLAKLTRPRTHRVLRRERLFAGLDEARDRPLVWISGPPGAGKSTLVASYIEARKCRAAWYHLDAGDGDPGTFFYYLAQSQTSRSKSAASLPLLSAEHRADLAGFSRHFFRQYFARPTLLILDASGQSRRAHGSSTSLSSFIVRRSMFRSMTRNGAPEGRNCKLF